jgi:hypothetical protein
VEFRAPSSSVQKHDLFLHDYLHDGSFACSAFSASKIGNVLYCREIFYGIQSLKSVKPNECSSGMKIFRSEFKRKIWIWVNGIEGEDQRQKEKEVSKVMKSGLMVSKPDPSKNLQRNPDIQSAVLLKHTQPGGIDWSCKMLVSSIFRLSFFILCFLSHIPSSLYAFAVSWSNFMLSALCGLLHSHCREQWISCCSLWMWEFEQKRKDIEGIWLKSFFSRIEWKRD